MVAFFNSPDSGSLTVEVYGVDDPSQRLNYIPRFEEASFLEELKRPGGGAVTLRSDDFKFLETPALLQRRNIVKCRYGNSIISAFIVQSQEEVYVDSTEGKASAVTYAGESLKSWFRDAEVYAEGGFKSDSAINRSFSFASIGGPWYVPSQWSPAVRVINREASNGNGYWTYGTPEGWTVEASNAWWVWTTAPSLNADVGSSYWRLPINVPTSVGTVRYKINLTVDDEYDLYVDGQFLGSGEDWNNMSEYEFVLSPGNHVIAMEVRNNQGAGGVLLALFRSTTAGDNGTYTVIYKSGDPGLVFYNQRYNDGGIIDPKKWALPGWTVGQILRILLEEAQARGVRFPSYLKPTFTDAKDSNGVPWLLPISWEWQLGTSYYEVLESLEEVQCEVWINPDNYELNVYVNKGRDLQQGNDAVQVRAARNIAQATRESKLTIKNAVLINAKGLWVEQTHAESIKKYGRIEGYLQTELSANTSRQVASAVLSLLTDSSRSLSIQIIPSEFAVPFLDFSIGDWISVTDPLGSMEKDRVVTLAIAAVRDQPLPEFSIELNTASEDKALKVARLISKLSKGTLNGNAFNSLT